jgi:tetratricopeptide (TPR) repeat protein
LTLAGQRIAEAQGRLGADARSLPALDVEIDAIRREIDARQADAARFAQFLNGASDAQDRCTLGKTREDATLTPEDVRRLVREALGPFGVLQDNDWLTRLENSYLTAEQKLQVRETAYVTLVTLAEAEIHWNDDPKYVHSITELLRCAQTFHEPTRAFYFVRAEHRRRQGDASGADDDKKRFQIAAARSAWDYFLPGHEAAWHGDLDEAIRSYRAALALQPNHYNSLFFLAVHFATDKINRWPEAVQLFTACIALRPDDYLAYYNRGVCNFHLRQLDDAITDYRRVFRLRPSAGRGADAHKNLGVALRDQGKLDEAVEECREAIRLRPDDAEAHSNLGLALQEQGKLDDGIAALREAIRLEPDDADVHTNLGVTLLDNGRLDEAIASFNQSIHLRPSQGCIYRGLGIALLRKGELDRAIAAFREAVRVGPADHADHHLDLGDALTARGEVAEANASYQKAIAGMNEAVRHNPSDPKAHNNLAWFLATYRNLRFRDPAWAVELARRAVELAPKERDYWNTLGAANYRAGDWKAAIAALEKSSELRNGGNAFDWFFLAMARRQLGQANEARTWYDKAVAWMEKNGPKNEELLRFRAEAAALLGLTDLPADVFARP